MRRYAKEIETKKFRLQLEADREARLAGGRNRSLGVKKGKVGKKDKKKKDKSSVGLVTTICMLSPQPPCSAKRNHRDDPNADLKTTIKVYN